MIFTSLRNLESTGIPRLTHLFRDGTVSLHLNQFGSEGTLTYLSLKNNLASRRNLLAHTRGYNQISIKYNFQTPLPKSGVDGNRTRNLLIANEVL